MIKKLTGRGFQVVVAETYPPDETVSRVVQQSSAIGDYDDSFQRPGSSYLWLGESLHLDRDQVRELTVLMQNWLETGRLFDEPD